MSSAFDTVYRDESFKEWRQINVPLFTLYFNRALQRIKDEIQKEPIDCRDINPRWVENTESSIPHRLRDKKKIKTEQLLFT